MTITALEAVRGTPYMSKLQLQDAMNMGKRAIDTRFKEIKEERERYGEYAYIKDGGFCFINYLVWVDYMVNRTRLKDRNLRKRVPDFDAVEVAKSIGWYGREAI